MEQSFPWGVILAGIFGVVALIEMIDRAESRENQLEAWSRHRGIFVSPDDIVGAIGYDVDGK